MSGFHDLQWLIDQVTRFLAPHGLNLSEVVLGEGGLAVVIAARWNGRECAVKISRRAIEESSDTKRESERGVGIWSLTHLHPGLLKNLGHFVVPVKNRSQTDCTHLVTIWERAKGTLPFPVPRPGWARALESLRLIAEAVDFLNSQRTFHRDIKPANIFVMEDGSLRLGDLGSAKTVMNPTLPSDTITLTPMIGPPEMLVESQTHSTIDTYCLAGTIVVVLAGETSIGVPWGSAVPKDFPVQMRDDQAIVRTLSRLGFSATMRDALIRALDPLPSRRAMTGAAALVNELLKGAREDSLQYSDTTTSLDGGYQVVHAPTPIARDDQLRKLGLLDHVLQDLVRSALGVDGGELPRRLRHSLVDYGAFRAKELAFELLESVRRVRRAIEQMRSKIDRHEPTDSEWSIIRGDYEPIVTERQLLRARLQHECDRWTSYGVVVTPICFQLDGFCADIIHITKGYVPRRWRHPDETKFAVEPTLLTLAAKIEYYRKSLDWLDADAPGWERECREFYREHCRLLD